MSYKSTKTSVNITRMLYLLVCEVAGSALAFQSLGPEHLWIGVIGGLIIGSLFILLESMMKQFSIRGFSYATFGLLIGLFCAWLLTTVKFGDLLVVSFQSFIKRPDDFILTINVILYSSLGFIGVALALRSTQEDFALIIPYVRFRQDSHQGQPLLLDSEAICDGRLPSLMQSGFLDNNLIIPHFILEDIQSMATSPSPGRRQRGQHGLDCLTELQNIPNIRVTIHDTSAISVQTHDSALIQIALLINAKLLTTEPNLCKIAKLQNVSALNINDLNNALKTQIHIGAKLHLAIVRTGKEEHQGVGYLPDGTMIVVNNAVSKIGTTQDVTVISTIQTSAGLMVFSEIDDSTQSAQL